MGAQHKSSLRWQAVACVAWMALAASLAGAQEPAPNDALTIVGRVPLAGEAFDGRIVIFFNQPVILPPAPEGTESTPISFEPDLKGTYRVEDNFIAFDALDMSGFVDAIFTVRLNPGLQSPGGAKVPPEQQTFTLATFTFSAKKLWLIESAQDTLTAGIMFPCPVNLDTLQKHMELKDSDGQAVAFTLEQGTQDRLMRIKLAHGRGQPPRLTLKAGLTDQTGHFSLKADQTLPMPRPSPLAVTGVEWEKFDEKTQIIKMWFSQPLHVEELRKHLSILDAAGSAIGFHVTSQGEDKLHYIQLDPPLAPPVNLSLAIAKGITAINGSTRDMDYSRKLEGRLPSPKPEPEAKPAKKAFDLRVTDAWFLDYDWEKGRKAGTVLRARLNGEVDLAELREHLEFDPPVENMTVEPGYRREFRVYGDWRSNQVYEIRITAGLNAESGAATTKTVTHRMQTGDIPEFLGFGQDGNCYFPRRAGVQLPCETRNIDEVKVRLHRMFPSNLAVALGSMREGAGSSSFNARWCEFVGDARVPVASMPDRIVETPLDLDTLFPADKKGVFCLEGQAKDTPSAYKLVLWTNLGVLAHWQGDGKQPNALVAFVHDLFTLEPMPLAKVSVYSSKNQFLGMTNAGEDGIAHLGPFDPALGHPTVLVAEYKDDFTFLKLDAREEDRRDFTDQMPRFDRDGYDAFVYADRDLYRPGETIHAHWIVRTNYGDAVADVPLLVTVLKPNGKELLTHTTTLSACGTDGLDIETQKVYPTGKYTIQLQVPGSKKIIGFYKFSLEEFVPNRIKAEVKLDQAVWKSGETYPIHLNAQHLFGAPAADRKCDAIVVLKRPASPSERIFEDDRWKGYSFSNDSEVSLEPVQCGEQKTDAEGNADLSFKYIAPPQATFPIKAITVGRVYELGGRAVGAKAESTLFPSDTCLGIKVTEPEEGEGIKVSAAALTPEGVPANLDKVTVTLERRDWHYYVRRYYSHHQSHWAERYETVETREITLADGVGSVVFQAPSYGHYRFRVHSEATPQFSTYTFYSYWNGFRAMDADDPSLLKIVLNKERYQVGDEVEVRVESPFDGKGIIVLQGDGIQKMIPIEVKDEVGVARFTAGPEQCPNVWVEATVIHALRTDRTQVYPFSSFATKSLAVTNPKRELNVTLPELPEEIRPATQAQFKVSVQDAFGSPVEAEVTLAAVDEGIHLITGYANPDPLGWLYRPRQPDLRRAHYYDKVAYDFAPLPIGGDALLRQIGKRISQADDNWIRPVALWSGVVKTDAAGMATVNMDVPEFTGQLRMVAVSCTPTALGETDGHVFVRRPCMLRTSLPRFLLPGDSFQSRATLFNNTDAPCKARISWKASGTLQQGAGAQELEVPPHGEAGFVAGITALATIGRGEIVWEAVVTDEAGQELERLAETNPVNVLTPGSYQSHHEIIALKPGETRELRNTQFLDDERAELGIVVGASPLLNLQDALKYLVRYPYGCVEQTTSCLLPMYVLRQHEQLVGPMLEESVNMRHYLSVGISRLLSMQTDSGGLAYWPGSNRPYPYGSIYALHFLTLVRSDREFDVPEENFRALQRYARSIAMDWTGRERHELYLRAYALYVLALDGDLEAIQQIDRFDTLTIPRSARYMLAAALALSTQDYDRVRMYLSTAPMEAWHERWRHGTLNSTIRNKAVELMALSQMSIASHEELSKRAQELVDYLRDHRYGNTQETAFVVTAIGAYLGGLATNVDAAKATITYGGKTEAIAGNQVLRAKQEGPGKVFAVTNSGAADMFVNLTTRGVPIKAQLDAVSKGGLRVTRALRTSLGKPYTDTVFGQTTSYIVDVCLHCNSSMENIVVADLLPAGFEVENPRLNADTLPGVALERSDEPDYLDVRDDRVVFAFNELPPGTHHLYYIVRAVTPGKYQYPGTQAECMYDAEIRATAPAVAIEVKAGGEAQ